MAYTSIATRAPNFSCRLSADAVWNNGLFIVRVCIIRERGWVYIGEGVQLCEAKYGKKSRSLCSETGTVVLSPHTGFLVDFSDNAYGKMLPCNYWALISKVIGVFVDSRTSTLTQ